MTEQELRSLVRQAIARQTPSRPVASAAPGTALLQPLLQPTMPGLHASHFMFDVTTGLDADGPCLIEPAVRCNHCGYCQSMGH